MNRRLIFYFLDLTSVVPAAFWADMVGLDQLLTVGAGRKAGIFQGIMGSA